VGPIQGDRHGAPQRATAVRRRCAHRAWGEI